MRVAIIDYGSGNLRSATKAFERAAREAGIDAEILRRWCDVLGWEKVLNRQGTTFRKLPDADRSDLNEDKAIALMVAQPAMIKRPILHSGDLLLAGFKPDTYLESGIIA